MSNSYIFGGNKISPLELIASGPQALASGPYQYIFYRFNREDIFEINNLSSYTLFVLDIGSHLSIVNQNDEIQALNAFDAIQCEGYRLKGTATAGSIFIIGGVESSKESSERSIKINAEKDLYKVVKPWGYEIWINGSDHSGYSLKKIKINKGTKTSLQYHQYKQETNVIYEGTALLHYKSNELIHNQAVSSQDISVELIKSVTAIDVVPQVLHRIEAVTDVLLYEISTPFLDDVIRVHDDSRRSDGKIFSEHQLNG